MDKSTLPLYDIFSSGDANIMFLLWHHKVSSILWCYLQATLDILEENTANLHDNSIVFQSCITKLRFLFEAPAYINYSLQL